MGRDTASHRKEWSPRHVRENAEASALDLTSVLQEIEALIPLGPAFVLEN
jgi:hypothetical protein